MGDADRGVYLDHNATSPLRPEAREAWLAVHAGRPGNPSSLHTPGRLARQAVDEARERVAAALGVEMDAVVFTSGGTEAVHLALAGSLAPRNGRGGGADRGRGALVTTAIEHSAVLEGALALERAGHPLVCVPCDGEGRIDAAAVLHAARESGAALVCVQAANNEVGSLGPLAEIGAGLLEWAPAERPRFVSDAVQALGRVQLDLGAARVDLAAFSAHKIGGPPGVGVLVRRGGLHLAPVLVGGGQEGGLRAGTEDAAGIAAAAVAIELAVSEREAFAARARAQVELLWRELRSRLPGLRLNGPPLGSTGRLPNTLNVSLPGTDGKVLVTQLDLAGLYASAGSACASGSIEPSHVLRAMGRDDDAARAGLRLSVGWCTTDDECRAAVSAVEKVLTSSRATCDGGGAL